MPKGNKVSRVLAVKNITREMLQRGQLEVELAGPPVNEPRPLTRGECSGMERPCPYVACRHHTFLDVDPFTGSIKFNYPAGIEPEHLSESCALDVADRGGVTLETVAAILNLTRERVRQIEEKGLFAARAGAASLGIDAKDSYFAHPRGFESEDAEHFTTNRQESARRARAAYQERQRVLRAKGGGQ